MSNNKSKVPPKQVQTQAEHALARYPELRILGYEDCCKVFALVASSLDQPPSSSASSSSSGLPATERAAEQSCGDAKRREWVRRLACVFDFEILPQPPGTLNPSPPVPTKPVHIYLDMLRSGLITLSPPPAPSSSSASGPRWKQGEQVTIAVTAKDLVKIATGEKLPVRLYQMGRLKIKGDVDKSLLLGKLLRITRSQIYHPSSSSSLPSKERTNKEDGEGPSHRDGLTGEGLQGQGSGSGDVGVGLGAGGRVRSRL